MKKINKGIIPILFLLFALTGCKNKEENSKLRKEINLAGEWQFSLDTADVGEQQKFYKSDLSDKINLPGSLDENKKGFVNDDSTDQNLNRKYTYSGKAWFRKNIEIQDDWANKSIALILERSKVTKVWIDSVFVGLNNTIYAQQVYDLTDLLTPGSHTITILVDNTEKLVPVAGSHAYSDNTQTNWNGIIGRFCLEAKNPVFISSVRTTPKVKEHLVNIELRTSLPITKENQYSISVSAELWNSSQKHIIKPVDYEVNGQVSILYFDLTDNVRLWSEFSPSLYKLNIVLKENGNPIDNKTIDFGMREFATRDQQFTINGTSTFLRGKHDACVFPLTGYPPTTVNEWIRVMKISQSYGLNHYRFHSLTPPEAAFQAADILGIYIQTELPIWWGFDSSDSTQVEYLTGLGKAILTNFANHPSFVMMSLGNEITQERKVLQQMVSDLRAHDSRPLFAQGSNNRLWDPSYAEGDDFWVSFRTGSKKEDNSTDIRTSMSFLDSDFGGILNKWYPSNNYNFSKALEESPVPVVGFEVGQYQVYPNYDEMKKYTGVLDPRNFEIFRQRLITAGMEDQAKDFFNASGQLSVLCYRADIEAAIRTPEFGGFHLLDLQDYPGQGTALVGMLDAFMDSKGLITPEKFREFCNDTVLLATFDKYCFSNTESFTPKILLANYGSSGLSNIVVNWKLSAEEDGSVIQTAQIQIKEAANGGLTEISGLDVALGGIIKPTKLVLELKLENTSIQNSYPLWVYPEVEKVRTESVVLSNKIGVKEKNILANGGKVLLLPKLSDISKNSVGNQFISEFWNFGMFTWLAERYGGKISHGTMGIVTNPKHALFSDFPTEFHTNWQWWPIVTYSRSVILDTLDSSYKPIVQIIDNINRNHKLGLVFEFKVDKGSLLICTSDLTNHMDKPEVKQFYNSLLTYAASENFKPEYEISFSKLKGLGF